MPPLRWGVLAWCAAARHLQRAQPLRLVPGVLQARGDEVSQHKRQEFQHTEQRTKNKKMIPVLTQVSFVRTDSPQWETWTPDVGIKPQRLHERSSSEQQIIIHKCRWAQAVAEILASLLCFILCAHPVRIAVTESFWQLKKWMFLKCYVGAKIHCDFYKAASVWGPRNFKGSSCLQHQLLQSFCKCWQQLNAFPEAAGYSCSCTRALEWRAAGRAVHPDKHCRAIILALAASLSQWIAALDPTCGLSMEADKRNW